MWELGAPGGAWPLLSPASPPHSLLTVTPGTQTWGHVSIYLTCSLALVK